MEGNDWEYMDSETHNPLPIVEAQPGSEDLSRVPVTASEIDKYLWDENYEKVPSADGRGYERANTKAYQAVCLHCKAENSWPENKYGWTCTGVRRDMVRHLARCTFFRDRRIKGKLISYMTQFNVRNRRATSGSALHIVDGQFKPLHKPPPVAASKDLPSASPERQDFEDKLLCMILDSSISFQYLERNSTAAFMQALRPGTVLPTRKHMINTVLDRVAQKVDAVMQKKLKLAKGVTLLFASWPTSNREQTIGLVVVTDDRQVFAFHVLSTTLDNETDDVLPKTVKDVVERLESEYAVEVHAITSEAAPNYKPARQLAVENRAGILPLDCAAHQVLLATQDFFKFSTTFTEVVARAMRISSWFLTHALPNEKLKRKSEFLLGKVATLELPVANRWESMAEAVSALLQVRTAMHSLCIEAGAAFIAAATSKALKEKAERVIEWCKDEVFWNLLEEVARVLVPLKVVNSILESEKATLGDVFKTTGQLYKHFGTLKNAEVKKLMQDGIGMRWRNMDQQIFVLAYVLQPDNRLQHLSMKCGMCQPQSLQRFVSEVFKRCMAGQGEPSEETLDRLQMQFVDYVNMDGIFSEDEGLALDSPTRYWKAWQATAPEISALAIRILGILPNASVMERFWMKKGGVDSKPRTSLSGDKELKMALVRADLKSKELAGQDVKRGVKRQAKSMGGEPAPGSIPLLVGPPLVETGPVAVGQQAWEEPFEPQEVTEEEVESMFLSWGWKTAQMQEDDEEPMPVSETPSHGKWSSRKCWMEELFDFNLLPLHIFGNYASVVEE